MATLRPSIRLKRSRRVSMSSSPWVGCSCLPSPALMTFERIRWPRNWAAPEAPWRITTMSIRIASRFRAVSTRVSPLLTEVPALATLTVSAQSRFSANSKEIRVRVEASKKRLTMVLPRSAGTFLIAPLAHFLERLGRVEDELDLLAAQRLEPDQVLAERGALMDALTSSTASRPSSSETQHVHPVARAGGHLVPDDVGLDRQLAAAAVDQDAEQDPARTPEVGELVERGPHGAAGVEHIVHDDDGLAVEVGEAGLADHRPGADGLEIVSVERDVELAAGDLEPSDWVDEALQPVGELDARGAGSRPGRAPRCRALRSTISVAMRASVRPSARSSMRGTRVGIGAGS